MKGEAKKFIQYLEGSNRTFIIPVYQRNYDWKKYNCKQLWDDLVKVERKNRQSHFFGSIVASVNTEGASSELLIIDGQQRITTVSLVLLAIVNLLKEGKVTSNRNNLSTLIEETYLIDKWQPEDKKIKLKPIKGDQQAFQRLFEDTKEYIRASNLTANYNFFYNAILSKELTVDELYDAISKLVIIDISLNPVEDNAQLIFESLNSTGLGLSEADKIRNYVLMGQTAELQEKYYETYWKAIETNTSFKVSEFIRDYLTIKLRRTPNIKNVYSEFKDYFERSVSSIEDILVDMKKYAEYSKMLESAEWGVPDINVVLKRFNILEMNVTRPYLLSLLQYYKLDKINEQDVLHVLKTIESYIFRRLMCSVPPNALNKLFASLHSECLRYITDDTSYVEVFNYLLLNKTGSLRFPKDIEFKEFVNNKDIFGMQSKNKIYLFNRLENRNSCEHVNVIENMKSGKYTIEHIMPRTLSAEWIKSLGPEHKRIQEQWGNTLANLTLTAYNSKYSNLSFRNKKNMEDGFKDSGFRMNDFLKSCDSWTEKELQQRSDRLKQLSVQLWPYPQSTYQPVQNNDEAHSLDEDFDFTGTQIISYTFQNQKHIVSTWKNAYIDIIRQLFDLDSTILYQFADSMEDTGLSVHFTNKLKDGYSSIKENVFVLTRPTSTRDKISTLRRLFERYCIEENSLEIEVKNNIK